MRGVPYTSFNGTCEEAITFYQSVLGGTTELMRFDSLPAEENIPVSDGWKSKVLHGTLTLAKGVILYFGDTWEQAPVTVGTNAAIHLEVDSESEVARLVEALSADGQVDMPADKTFWGSTFGSVVDKFGVLWNIEHAEG